MSVSRFGTPLKSYWKPRNTLKSVDPTSYDTVNRDAYKNMFYKIVRQRYPNKESDAYIQPLVDEKESNMYKQHGGRSISYTSQMTRLMWSYSIWSDLVTDNENMAKDILSWWRDQIHKFDGSEQHVRLFVPYMETFSFFCTNFFSQRVLQELNDALGDAPAWLYLQCRLGINMDKHDIAHEFLMRSCRHKFVPALVFNAKFLQKRGRWSEYAMMMRELIKLTEEENYKIELAKCFFYGLGVKQCYESGRAYFDASVTLCGANDKFNQIPIMIRMIVQGSMINSAYFLLSLRLVCKKWNRVVLSCGEFWKRFHVLGDLGSVPLEGISQLAIDYSVNRYINVLIRDMERKEQVVQVLSDRLEHAKRTFELAQERVDIARGEVGKIQTTLMQWEQNKKRRVE